MIIDKDKNKKNYNTKIYKKKKWTNSRKKYAIIETSCKCRYLSYALSEYFFPFFFFLVHETKKKKKYKQILFVMTVK